MHSDLPATIEPDRVESLPERFRIEGPIAVRAILRELISLRVPVVLYGEGDLASGLVARVAALDDTDGTTVVEIEVLGHAEAVGSIATARNLVAVAFPGKVKTQFQLTDPTVVATEAGPAPAGAAHGITLRAPIPGMLYRTQRRDSFRVQPPPDDEARCVRRVAPGEEAHYALYDLSAGGASILLPAGGPVPAPGEIWQHSRLEAANDRTIPVDLIVRRVIDDPADAGRHRVALAFRAPPPEVMRAIQVYVIDIERRLRQLRPACS